MMTQAVSAPSCCACGRPLSIERTYRRGIPSDLAGAGRFDILSCFECGTGQTSPFPGEDDLNRLYEKYGAKAPSPETAPRDVLVRLRRWFGAATARYFYDMRSGRHRLMRRLCSCFVVPRVTLAPLRTEILGERCRGRPLRLLDVGCGSCEFLEFARAAGVQGTGTEVTQDAVECARKLGLDVLLGTVHDVAMPGSFDIIRFSHVLEHVRDPLGDLRKAHDLAGPGGYLMVAVPEMPSAVTLMGMSTSYHVPFHLHHFTRKGMRLLLARAGFKVLTVKSKSNSLLIHSLSQRLGKSSLANHAGMRVLCIAFEVLFDAVGLGDSMEIHAVAE